MNPEWARSLRDKSQAAGVPFFFKQWGSARGRESDVRSQKGGDALDGWRWHQWPEKNTRLLMKSDESEIYSTGKCSVCGKTGKWGGIINGVRMTECARCKKQTLHAFMKDLGGVIHGSE
jgi:hypothetical protein